MKTRSPFSDNRFEYEVRHLYYIQEALYSKLQRTKPCFLIGSRGTGKTTLLRSLSWRERLSNEGLRNQVGCDTFQQFIAVYIKLPDVQLDAISSWLDGTPDASKRAIYSRYLELIQLQEIFEAVSELEAAGELHYSAAAEQKAVKKLIDEFGEELYLISDRISESNRPPNSFAGLSKSTRMLRRYVEKASQQNASPLDVLKTLGSPTQICSLSRAVARSLVGVISNTPDLFFKVCFDEAETLDAFGVQVLATWVRLSADSLYHVVSFVSKPDSLSETFIPNLSVQSADAEFLELDGITDKQFKSFAEGVATLRVSEFARRSKLEDLEDVLPFNTEKVFGKLNLNFLLEDTLRESVSPLAKSLLEEAAYRVGLDESSNFRVRKGDDSALPIYETYLELRTNRVLPGEALPRWSKRRAESQLTRKAMVGAYLSIMNELRTSPRYAYADMILQLSDNCIRDFLNNIECIYKASSLSLPDFLATSKLRATIQNSGLLAASKAKVRSLPTRGLSDPSCTAKLVSGLGKLTHLLQSQSKDKIRHLKATERGVFHLATAVDSDLTNRAVKLVVDAAEAGFLKVLESDELLIRFRVHTSLAPVYEFSYRGAYYPVTIQSQDIIGFADALDEKEIERLSGTLFDRMDGSHNADLFSGELM